MLFQWAAVTFSIHTPFKVLFFVKKYRTMERKKRSKGSVWEFCYANKIFGTFEEEMKAYGQKWVTFCTHTRGYCKLVVRISQLLALHVFYLAGRPNSTRPRWLFVATLFASMFVLFAVCRNSSIASTLQDAHWSKL